MKRNLIWIGFLVIVSLMALWFVLKAGREITRYFLLTAQVQTEIKQWSVEEIKSDQFAVMAHYTFEYQGKVYEKTDRVNDLFPNPWAAQEALKRFSQQRWPAYLNPKYPEEATLHKEFPLKKAISAAILIALTLYFLILAFYMRVKK